jgi:hypothetical protein
MACCECASISPNPFATGRYGKETADGYLVILEAFDLDLLNSTKFSIHVSLVQLRNM